MSFRLFTSLLIIIAMFLSLNVSATPVNRTVDILRIHPMSMDRVHCPTCSGITRIYVTQGAWGNTSCRGDAGDLLKEDDHILSILLAAWVSGKTIKLEVNDDVIPIGGVCKITAAFVE